MAIGRTFHESLQKALASLETDLDGLDEIEIAGTPADEAVRDPDTENLSAFWRGIIERKSASGAAIDKETVVEALSVRSPDRLRLIAQAMRHGLSDPEINRATQYDPWFLARIREILEAEEAVKQDGLPESGGGLRGLKSLGFTDARLARLSGKEEAEVRSLRRSLGVRPVFKRIDTCAAEFDARTPYMYSTYEAPLYGEAECEAWPTDRRKIAVLGGGPNRIGQGIEFDYCCCHACMALTASGYETIMVNCNPETVSTDYDTSDRLYFEPLTHEHVSEILAAESRSGELAGTIVQFGGQTPLKLAHAIEADGFNILGTKPDSIDLAEDRERFKALLNRLGLKQPRNGIAHSADEAARAAEEIGYPVVIRPSYVLGGRAMEIVRNPGRLRKYMRDAVSASGRNPVLIDQFLPDAVEVDVDALCDGRMVRVAGVMQHIELAGVHSGDSACSLPPHSLDPGIVRELERQTGKLAMALDVRGLMNVQFAVQDGTVYLLEVNPRASRTVPFVAKATGNPVASIAAEVMAGQELGSFEFNPHASGLYSVKEAVLPFGRFPGVDALLGPEMRSTGEVMGTDATFPRAFLKAQIGAGVKLPSRGNVFISFKDSDKNQDLEQTAKTLSSIGYSLLATRGTAAHLNSLGIGCELVAKVYEGRPNVVDRLREGAIAVVMNTADTEQAITDSKEIRSMAVTEGIPYCTTAAASLALAQALASMSAGELEATPIQGMHGG